MFELTQILRLPNSKIEVHGDKKESKKETVEKIISQNLIWKSLKQ